ncbi:MAG: D-cysteine desulfhydrase [Acidobacteria bacterium]|nr:MAG: D-cysteine desulfhydrase [Acidobacteriota bacterium]
MLFSRYPRVRLAHLPTPLEPLERLSARLGGPRLLVKRDDCTGLATGGNKTRKLEFLVGEALAQGADTLITVGAVQSNHVRQTAAAAARCGLHCEVLLERRVPDTPADYERTGNVQLDRLCGAVVHFRDGGVDMLAEAEELAGRLAAQGRRPYVIPGGGSNPVGALGYALAAFEIVGQLAEREIVVDRIVHATGSTGTQAGLLAGLHAMNVRIPVLGICVSRPEAQQVPLVHDLAQRTADLLGATTPVPREVVTVDDRFVGPGYGRTTPATVEALRLAAREEGLLLDPVYSGKAMAGLISLIREGAIPAGETVLFVHTGGAAALPAYLEELDA